MTDLSEFRPSTSVEKVVVRSTRRGRGAVLGRRAVNRAADRSGRRTRRAHEIPREERRRRCRSRRRRSTSRRCRVSRTAVAARALVNYHLERQRPMMGAFLDSLGITHENGLISEENVTKPDAEKLKAARRRARDEVPARQTCRSISARSSRRIRTPGARSPNSNRRDRARARLVARRCRPPRRHPRRSNRACARSSPPAARKWPSRSGRSTGAIELLIDADKPFHAASTMKVPVMIELFRQAHARHALARRSAPHPQRVPQHRRRQHVTRSAKETTRTRRSTLRRGTDADAAAAVRGDDHGQQQFRGEPAHRAARRRQHPPHGEGARRGRHAGAARRRGSEGVRQGAEQHDHRARAAVLFDRLAHGTAVDTQSDAEMVAILKRQKFNDAIPAGVARRGPSSRTRPATSLASITTRQSCCLEAIRARDPGPWHRTAGEERRADGTRVEGCLRVPRSGPAVLVTPDSRSSPNPMVEPCARMLS